MKKLAKISSQLLTIDLTESLHLNEQSFLILIPKSLLSSLTSDSITFDLVIKKGRLSLIEPDLSSDPRVPQSVVKECVTCSRA